MVDDTPNVLALYAAIRSGDTEGIDGDIYHGYREDLYSTVEGSLSEHLATEQREKLQLIMGLIEDALVVSGPVAFARR